MATLKLEWNQAEFRNLERGPMRALFRTLSKAGGDTIRAVRVASSRTIRFRKRISPTKVNDGLKLSFPRAPAGDLGALEWRMRANGTEVPLRDFPSRIVGARTRGRKGRKELQAGGLKVQVNRGRWGFVQGAFEAKMRSGHVGIFVRKGLSRLPIKELFTTRITDVFGDAGMVPAVFERGTKVFSSSFARLWPLELAKVGAK